MNKKLSTHYIVQEKYCGDNENVPDFVRNNWRTIPNFNPTQDCEAKKLAENLDQEGWKYRVVELQRKVVAQYE